MIKATIIASTMVLVACGGSKASDGPAAPAAPAAPIADEAAPTEPTPAAAPAAAPANRPAAEVAVDAVAFLEGVSAIVVKNDGNCDGMGDGLTAHMTANKAIVDEMKVRKDDPAVEAELKNKHQDKMMAAVGPMMGPLQACKDNPKVKSAMESL